MGADADHRWRNRAEASSNAGDAWSGGGRAYRRWIGAERAPDPPASALAGQDVVARATEQGIQPGPEPLQIEQSPVTQVVRREQRFVLLARRFDLARERQNVARQPRSIAEVLLLIFAGIPLVWRGPHKRFGVAFALVAAGLGAVVLLTPLAWAGRWSACGAAEVALVDAAVGHGSRFEGSKARVANWMGPDGRLLSQGRVGKQIAAEVHTGWPPLVGCTALFWSVR